MFVPVLCYVAIALACLLGCLYYFARLDVKFYESEWASAERLIVKYMERDMDRVKVEKERTVFDSRISQAIRDKDVALAEATKACEHNYNEGKASQKELDALREKLCKAQAILCGGFFGEATGGPRFGPPTPKGWDVLRVTNQ